MKPIKEERPEALATFAEASRSGGKKPDELGLVADKHARNLAAAEVFSPKIIYGVYKNGDDPNG